MTTTLEHLRAVLIKDYKLDPEALTLDAPLEALGIDSLGLADLLFNVEDEFKITVSPDAVTLLTLGDVVAFIDDLVVQQHGSGAASRDAIAPGLQGT
jgi:acyl carrier protein